MYYFFYAYDSALSHPDWRPGEQSCNPVPRFCHKTEHYRKKNFHRKDAKKKLCIFIVLCAFAVRFCVIFYFRYSLFHSQFQMKQSTAGRTVRQAECMEIPQNPQKSQILSFLDFFSFFSFRFSFNVFSAFFLTVFWASLPFAMIFSFIFLKGV